MSMLIARLWATRTAAALLAAGFVVVEPAGSAQAAPAAQVVKPDYGTSQPLTDLAATGVPAAPGILLPERGPAVSDAGHEPDGALDQIGPNITAIPNATTFAGLTGTAQPP